MSLNDKLNLSKIAKIFCRDLRKNQTFAEKLLWEKLRSRKLLNIKFYRQYHFFHDITGKESFFIADFYSHELKLIIEIDGVIHEYSLSKDNERTRILNHYGLNVIRFKNEEIMNDIENVLNKIKVYIK